MKINSFSEFMDNLSRAELIHYVAHLNKFMRYGRDENDHPAIMHNAPNLPLWAQVKVAYYFSQGTSGITNLYVMMKIVQEGPKILQFRQMDFEALEHLDITLRISDYNQPFPTMVIIFPDNYLSKREVTNPLKGLYNPYHEEIYEDTHKPLFAIIHHDEDVQLLLLCIYMSSGDVLSSHYGDKKETIEQQIKASMELNPFEHSLTIDQNESALFATVGKAAINACLVATEGKLNNMGPFNPKHYSRIQHFIDVAKKKKDQKKLTEETRKLKLQPVVYEINQDIKLFKVEKEEKEEKEEGQYNQNKREMPCHWRSGHWRMQPYGEGRFQKKRIRIKAVLVNPHKFGGDLGQTRVTYHD